MKRKYSSIVITLIGGIIYLLFSLQTASYSNGLMDEGSYLNKGYIFASGQIEPFEDYGPQTGKMPLSYLPFGFSQLIFGNGLETGRFTAIFFGCLMLIPLWLTTRRLSNEWWATAAVWLIALNATTVWNYSLAFSQPIVVCLLAWSLYYWMLITRIFQRNQFLNFQDQIWKEDLEVTPLRGLHLKQCQMVLLLINIRGGLK